MKKLQHFLILNNKRYNLKIIGTKKIIPIIFTEKESKRIEKRVEDSIEIV